MEATIKVLDMTKLGFTNYGEPRYRFSTGGFPSRGIRAVAEDFDTPEAAYARATKVVEEYERADVFGNMGAALGVTIVNGKYRPVVNLYHSNT